MVKEPNSYILENLASTEAGGDEDLSDMYKSEATGYCRSYTGLQLATSLSAVKEKIFDVARTDSSPIIDEFAQNTTLDTKSYTNGNVTKDTIENALEDADFLSILDDDTYDTVLYSLVDLTEYAVAKSDNFYINNNIYGIAFYDFQLQVMANDELSYITAAEGYDDLEDAVAGGASGVTYKTSSGGDNNINYYQNGSDKEADVGMEFTQSDSMEVSNTMEEASTYEFSEMIGSETKLTAGIPEILSLEQTFKAEFTSSEALSTAYSESTSALKETSSTVTTSMSLPAQTAVSIESSTGTTNASVEYDCPVALTYKVAVFSVSPTWFWKVSGNNVKVKFTIDNYSGLSTVFGSEYEIGGQDAMTNLYNRAITYRNMDSYDRSYGQVTGNYRNGADHIDNLDWNSILNGEINLGDLEKETLPIYIERYKVDSAGGTAAEGELISQSLYGNGYIGYETTVEVPSTFTDTDDDGNEILYTLYEGPVYDSDGNNLNADLEKDDTVDNYYSKSVVPKSDTTCTAKFYYTADETPDQTEEQSDTSQSEDQTEDNQPEPTSLIVSDVEEPVNAEPAEETAAEESVISEEQTGEAAQEETVVSEETAEPEETIIAEETAEPEEPEETAAAEETAEPEETIVAEETAEPEETAAAEETAEPEETIVAEETAEPEETAAVEETAEPEETIVAEETAEPEEPAAAEETADPTEHEAFVEEFAEPEETFEIAEYDLTVAAEETSGSEETADPEEVEVYEVPAESYDEIIVEDGDLIGSVSNGVTVAGVDSTGSTEPALTIESIEVVESAEIPEELQDGEDAAAEEVPGSTDIMPMSSDVMFLDNIEGINDDVIWIVTHKPMSVTGATLDVLGKTTSSEIYGIVPIYPLDYTKVTSDQKTFDMITGTTLNVDNIVVDGFNKNDIEYYGFNQDKGYWVLADEDGNVLENSSVASLSTNSKTGVTLLSADGEGTVYLDYLIDESAGYTYMDGTDDPATNDKMTSAASVQINIANGPFNGTVVASGTLTGYVNDDEPINLDTADGIEAEVFDENDKKIYDAAITWESQKGEQDGIILEDNRLSFTKAGTYKIRAVYGYSTVNTNPYSDWITVTALPEKKLDKLTIADKTSPATLSDITLGDGKETVNLGWLTVSAVDQYENEWTELDDLTWYVDGTKVGSGTYTATKAGTHKVYAMSNGVKSNELTLTVYASRQLSSLKISDKTSPATLSDIILGDGKESINLGKLTVSAVDQYNKTWSKLDDLTWYVDGTALSSSTYTATKAGTHTIYAMSSGVKSNELTLTVNAARKLSSLKISDKTSPKTLAEVTYGEGKEKVDLSKLTISGTDQYGDKWTDMSSLKWYVDDQALSGSIYTVKNTSAGTHSIYAQCSGVKSNKLSISVKVPATSVKLNKESLEIKDGKTKQLTATVNPSGTTDTVTWTSSKTSVATVSSDGTVTAVAPGTATITVKATSGKSATCEVHVVYKKNETFSEGSYSYIVKDSSTDGTGKVYMNGFASGKSRKKVTVPDTVTINDTTYKVTSVSSEAFKGNSKIRSFTTGANVTSIGTSAFENCKNLKTVNIGNSVKKIKFKAFYDCYKLKNLTIGKNVNFMGAHCFCNDSKLKTITIKTTKLKKKNVESPHVFINVNNATMKVPKSKYKTYKKLFTTREYGGKFKK